MKKQFGEYYVGLDLGTNSIGWAVTDRNYNLFKLNGKSLWGIRLFDAAQTAADMRIYRSARRRVARMAWRLMLLQELFAEEIAKVDPGFFHRLKESNLQIEEKSFDNKIKYSLFGKSFLSDKEYYEKYPTIYHLRKALIMNDAGAFDIRLVYLAVAHLLKHRGHFLFNDVSGEVSDFSVVYNDLVNYIRDNLEGFEEWTGGNPKQVEDILKNRDMAVTSKKKQLEGVLNAANKQEKAIAAFLSGATASFCDLFADDDLNNSEKPKLSFKTDNFDEAVPELEKSLGERVELVEKLKAVYDWSLLTEILHGKTTLSAAKVEIYTEHETDLKILKEITRDNHELYKTIFVDESISNNYCAYIGSVMKAKGRKIKLTKNCNQADFCKFLRDKLKGYVDFDKLSETENSPEARLYLRIKNDKAFPKQTSKGNGVIPMQINLVELEKIIANAQKHFAFLTVKDESGLSIGEKIIEIMKFRIPYYVGPLAGTELARAKRRCWVVRGKEKITPWNFNKVVNKAESAEAFIRNMTNKCTYLEGEDVLPKNSLLYSEFMLRNEVNNLTVNGERLPAEIIDGLIKTLIINGRGRVTKKKITEYLITEGFISAGTDIAIGGIDDVVKSGLQSYKDFCRIFSNDYVEKHLEEIEEIITWITLFSDEKAMLITKIKDKYPHISDEQLTQIKRLNYKDWGRLSGTLLNSNKIAYLDESTGEIITIIEAMRQESKNLMELLSDSCEFGFREKIEEYNDGMKKSSDSEKVTYKTVESLFTSPANKRMIWQTMLIVKEIEKITGHAPNRIFVEMARGEGEKKRTKSRKEQLLELYKECRRTEPELYAELAEKSEEDLRSRKLFLYFTQMGKCMYTGERIHLSDLYVKTNGTDLYDKDHIFPRAKTKDDSLDNLVLVHYKENREKTDVYPLKTDIQQKMGDFWRMLKEKGLISSTKYERLIRRSPLSAEELAGFINRQLVETQQSTKLVAELLKMEFKDKTEIVYSKAGNVSGFRQEFGFVKCREVNDLHHAKDAYLNIVVGNAYHTRFTANPYNFIKKHNQEKYTLKTGELFGRDIKRGEDIAWEAGENGTMNTVKRTMGKNNILFTRMAQENKGQLYDLQLLKKGNGQIPVKKGMPIERYGGYNKPASAFYMLVESVDKKGKSIRTIETIPIIMAKRIQSDKVAVQKFLQEECGLLNPKVLIGRILKYSELNINGSLLHITGKTGNRMTGALASQLIIGEEAEKYIKRVCKFAERYAKNNNSVITKFDKLTKEENEKLYLMLFYKHKSNAYKNRPSGQIKTLENGLKFFTALNVEKQCIALSNILNLFICKPVTSDLLLVGGTKTAGKIGFSKDISKFKKAVLINQSITGVFEQQIDLLKI